MKNTDSNIFDNELLSRLKENSQYALLSIYDKYWDKLFVTAGNLLQNSEEAEECVQNVFIGLWNKRSTLKLEYNLQTYLAVSVKYQCFTLISKNKKIQNGIKDLPIFQNQYADNPEELFFAQELQSRIETSINNLPSQCRIVFILQKEQELSIKEIAEKLDLSQNTVKMHIKNANRKLRNDLLIIIPLMIQYYFEKK